MRLLGTTEDLANQLGDPTSTEQAVGLDHLALAVNPLGLYRVQPRALLGQKAGDDAHPTAAALFDFSVVRSDPGAYLLALVPADVIPHQKQRLFAQSLEPFAAPFEELGGYGAHRPTVHETRPRLFEFGQVEPVARDGLGVGIVLLGERLFDQTRGPSFGFWPSSMRASSEFPGIAITGSLVSGGE